MRAAFLISLKVVALTIIMFACFAGAGAVFGQQGDSQTPEQAGAAAAALLAVCFLNTLVLTPFILRSRLGGFRLMAAVFVVFYGVMTFMSLVEAAVFVTRLPQGGLPRLFLMGALVAAPFSVLAVMILGKRRAGAVGSESDARRDVSAGEWAWKLALIGIAYLILYITFGYFIAWRDPALREYYGGVDAGGFFAHMGAVLRDMPWLVPFQLLRAALWVGLALPVTRMMKASRLEIALTVGALFAVLMNAQLLLPNPYMPQGVRMTHLIETATSNFIFGFLIGCLFAPRREFAAVPILQNEGAA